MNDEDVISKRCATNGCKTQPKFGTEWHKPVHCNEHKAMNDEDVISKRCATNGCKTQPSFGTEWHKPVHCNEHKTVDDEDVISMRCATNGCKTCPTFGMEWRKPVHCKEHKTANEENVISKRCGTNGCKTQPSFGTEWHKPVHCKEHKAMNDEDVISKRCATNGCKTQPKFGTEWHKPVHCKQHKAVNEENVINKRCATNGCKTYAVADGFCTRHHPEYKPSAYGASRAACVFMDKLSTEICRQGNKTIHHKHFADERATEVTGGEHNVAGTGYYIDGYLEQKECKTTLGFPIRPAGLAIEFHGHLWHGHPDEDKHNDITFYGARVGDLYDQTMDRMREIHAQGYTVIYIWEEDFASFQRGNSSRSLLSFCHVL